ncbi:hypothetical protein [Arthrobacter sp. TMS1-12-1]
MDEPKQRAPIIDAVRRSGLTAVEMWVQYFALGGSLSELEIEAYLEGDADLAPLERELLAEAAQGALGLDPPAAGPLPDDANRDFLRLLGAAGSVFVDAEAAERGRVDSLEQLRLLGTPPSVSMRSHAGWRSASAARSRRWP